LLTFANSLIFKMHNENTRLRENALIRLMLEWKRNLNSGRF
jgi:hypothetical protein